MRRTLAVFFCAFCALCGEGFAQRPDGYVSVGLDGLPNAPGAPIELRARLFADEKITPFEHLTFRAAGAIDLLGFRDFVSDDDIRSGRISVSATGGGQKVKFVPNEFQVEVTGDRGDVRVGYSRVVWGRLDEVQPTDVVNPLDLARFFFEGRGEARLAVPMLRGRLFFGERANVEALIVPQFRRGRFDLLDEPSSPFNLEMGTVTIKTVTVPITRAEPATTWRNMQGGARFSATMGRVDWAASFYRGFDAFGTYRLTPIPERFVQVFPLYTMIGGDFETTKGTWALRGEVAHLSGEVEGLDGGLGFDRRAGGYRVSGTVLVHHESARPCAADNPACAVLPASAVDEVEPPPSAVEAYTSTSLVAAADRTFARERYRTRTFAVYNATERATFLRNITSMEVRTNVTLEGSIGWFFGSGVSRATRDVLGRFSDRDFLYARLRVHF